jgi:hypothetical protein
MLVDFYNKPPDKINETQLQDYFLHRRNVDKWSAATMRICYSGINEIGYRCQSLNCELNFSNSFFTFLSLFILSLNIFTL